MKSFIIILFFPFLAMSSELFIKAGVDPIAKRSSITDSKYFGAGYGMDLTKHAVMRTDVGIWFDKGVGARDSGIISLALGVKITPWILDIRFYSGAALMANLDAYLGGHLQFLQALRIGFHQDKYFIGAEAMHYSSGDLFKPNRGRNYLTIVVGIPI